MKKISNYAMWTLCGAITIFMALGWSEYVHADDQGQNMHVHWIAPTQLVDGTPLTDLEGYNLSWGPSSRNYTTTVNIADPAILEWDVPNGAELFVAITAYNPQGESIYSNEKHFPDPAGQVPKAPILL